MVISVLSFYFYFYYSACVCMCVCVCCNAVLEITWTQGGWRKKGSIQEWSADSCFILFPSPELVSETPAGVHRYMKHWRQKVWQILERLNMTVNQNTNTKRLAHEKANALLCSKTPLPSLSRGTYCLLPPSLQDPQRTPYSQRVENMFLSIRPHTQS